MMYRWDGGFIMVSWDGFDAGVEWYTKHMGWQCLDRVISSVGKKAFLKMPRAGVVTLKSFDRDYEHFQRTGDEEGHMRLCFEIGDIENTVAYFKENNIAYTDPITMPNGLKRFDFYAFENARITVYENPEHRDVFPDSRVLGFGVVNSHIGVTDVEVAAEWYVKNLGFELVSIDTEKRWAHLQTEDAYDRHVLHSQWWDTIFLEKIDRPIKGDPMARTYFDIRPEDFFEAYNLLIKNGIKPSQLAGDPFKGWAGFHIYDPDDNRINVWSYQMM